MKNILALIIFAFSLTAQAQTRISTNGYVLLEAGAFEQYETPDLYVSGSFNVRNQSWTVSLTMVKASDAVTEAYKAADMIFTKSEVDAYTGTGTGDTEKLLNALHQAVADKLLSINPGITFTLH